MELSSNKNQFLYSVTIASSNEYGCDSHCVGVFTTKRMAQKALNAEYRSSKYEMESDYNDVETEKDNDSFLIKNYECSYDCISGIIEKIVLNA